MADADGKTCRVCKQRKALTEFDKAKGNKDGHAGLCKACRAAYYRANADRYRQHAKKWRQADPARAKRKDAEQRTRAGETRLAATREWKRQNASSVAQYNRAYVARNLAYYRARNAQRRARISESPSHHTEADVVRLFSLQRGCCAVCRKKLVDFHVDHIVALSRGGTNERTNVQLLCPPCNRSKHAKDPIDFMQSRGLLL